MGKIIVYLPHNHLMSGRRAWDVGCMPRMDGKIAIVTGGSSGIGRVIVRTLAAMGAEVVMAVRDVHKGDEIAEGIRSELKDATVGVMKLDLSDMGSVGDFITSFKIEHDSLDLLINNAGVMVPPYSLTSQGYELQWGVNHLGHFALTGLLIDHLIGTPGSRIVTQTSMAHWSGDINFDDINSEVRYKPWKAYQQSKLANLLFTLELQRRLDDLGLRDPISLASHPGISKTPLFRHESLLTYLALRPLMQNAGRGALTALRAATDPDVRGGELYGPSGITEFKGFPVKVNPRNRGNDKELAGRVWALSEEMTSVRFEKHLRAGLCSDCGCLKE